MNKTVVFYTKSNFYSFANLFVLIFCCFYECGHVKMEALPLNRDQSALCIRHTCLKTGCRSRGCSTGCRLTGCTCGHTRILCSGHSRIGQPLQFLPTVCNPKRKQEGLKCCRIKNKGQMRMKNKNKQFEKVKDMKVN